MKPNIRKSKAFFVLFILYFLFITGLSAQDYQTVLPDIITYFNDPSGRINCIRIDSVKNEDNIVLYPFPNILSSGEECVNPNGDSWPGQKVIIREGESFFFNKFSDTIKVETGGEIDDSWLAFYIEDSLTISARVSAHDTITFLGITDSVKTIEFSVYDKDMNEVETALNSMSVLISKNHGFVRTLNFSLFPFLESNSIYETYYLSEYVLVGLSEPEVGIQNITWFEVFDFQPGDELHVVNSSSETGFECSNRISNTDIISRYLSRQDYKDSIVYVLDRKIHSVVTELSDVVLVNNFTHDTIREVIYENPEFDYLPGEPVITDNELYSNIMFLHEPKSKFWKPFITTYWPGNDCWSPIIADGCLFDPEYIEGLGGPYLFCDGGVVCWNRVEKKLVFYKKGNETWGEPLIITNNIQIQDIAFAKVYPNPTNGLINLEFNSIQNLFIEFSVYNTFGEIFYKEKYLYDDKNTQLDLTFLPSGFYLVELKINSKKELFKLIITK